MRNVALLNVTSALHLGIIQSAAEGKSQSGMIFEFNTNTIPYSQSSNLHFTALNHEDANGSCSQTRSNTSGCFVELNEGAFNE
jgi:hypothetical protein